MMFGFLSDFFGFLCAIYLCIQDFCAFLCISENYSLFFFEEIGREGPYLVTLIKLSLITVLMSMYMPHPVTGRVMR
jgi:hypothetical protein